MKYRRLLGTSLGKIAIFCNRLGEIKRLRRKKMRRRTVKKKEGKRRGGAYRRTQG